MPTQNLFLETSPALYLYEWTKNFPAGPQAEPRINPIELGAPSAWVDQLFPPSLPHEPLTPEGDPFTTSLRSSLDTLSFRRSVRNYADTPLTRAELAQFLALCYPSQVADPGYQPDPLPHQGLKPTPGHITGCRLFPLVLNVEGLASGVYYYDERQRHLRHIRVEDPMPFVQEHFFQAEFLAAPVMLLTLGSVSDYLLRYGDRGYRYMLFDVGLLLQRMYLVTSCLDLSGCTTGSLVQGAFEQWLGVDGFQGSVLKAFAIGHKIVDEDEEMKNGS